ncbi:MAG: glutaminyl-peptide cyclotransferase [Niabella sp.]
MLFAKIFYITTAAGILFELLTGCNGHSERVYDKEAYPATPIINYAVVQTYPHDTSMFTEGLVFYKGALYESSGSPAERPYTKSIVGTVDLQTGKVTPKVTLDKTLYFGEGIVFLKDKLYQLTYTNQKGFIYDAASFKKTGEFAYANREGWGLTTDGRSIIMSDGTTDLTWLDPQTLHPVKTLAVTENGTLRDSLNELEFINGAIYANVWTKPYILKIDTASGEVTGRLDLSAIVDLVGFRKLNADVLNGIACDAASGKVYITGKLWPSVYEIDFQK